MAVEAAAAVVGIKRLLPAVSAFVRAVEEEVVVVVAVVNVARMQAKALQYIPSV